MLTKSSFLMTVIQTPYLLITMDSTQRNALQNSHLATVSRGASSAKARSGYSLRVWDSERHNPFASLSFEVLKQFFPSDLRADTFQRYFPLSSHAISGDIQ
ncbi:hypothetical protein NSMM_400236 [Nitrosomonas mobilis]|uniref:Uncharacterized protein n=1 Tax=Nitrosomonas mobilis TaxID=51642 RepID=A0A1G5SF69_9PROT|nr:hypothetical protein NSMM_400236 [Nitrosomonas mobilis]